MLGCLYLDEGKPEEALTQFEAGLRLRAGTPDMSRAYANMGRAGIVGPLGPSGTLLPARLDNFPAQRRSPPPCAGDHTAAAGAAAATNCSVTYSQNRSPIFLAAA